MQDHGLRGQARHARQQWQWIPVCGYGDTANHPVGYSAAAPPHTSGLSAEDGSRSTGSAQPESRGVAHEDSHNVVRSAIHKHLQKETKLAPALAHMDTSSKARLSSSSKGIEAPAVCRVADLLIVALLLALWRGAVMPLHADVTPTLSLHLRGGPGFTGTIAGAGGWACAAMWFDHTPAASDSASSSDVRSPRAIANIARQAFARGNSP